MKIKFLLPFLLIFNIVNAQVPSSWDSTATYTSGALVLDASGVTYIAQQDVSTPGTTLTDTTYWKSLDAAAPTTTPTGAPTTTPDTSTVPSTAPDTNETTVDIRLKGISTNATVTPTALMVAGVTITGGTKKVVFQVQATGTYASTDGYLQDPVLYIVSQATGAVVATVDNWQNGPDTGYDATLYSDSYLTELQNSSYAMAGASESAIIMNLPEGSYTALVGSKSGTETAKAIVAAFDFE